MRAAELRAELGPFFAPKAVVFVGSVDRTVDPEQFRLQQEARWRAPFYLVNPKGGSLGEIPIYSRIADLPQGIDVAVLEVPTRAVAGVIEECAAKGIRRAVVMTVGFSEVGGEGVQLERDLAEVIKRTGVRMIGPNTHLGVFERFPVLPAVQRKIALLSHSGSFLRPVIQATDFGVAFSRWVACGNEVDLEAADFLEYFAYDDDTSVIAGYFEGFRDGAKLRQALHAAAAERKPVVVVKIGRTEAGSRAARSHTAHLTGSDRVIDGLFRQYAVTRVGDVDELAETAALFAKLPDVPGPRVCCYGYSGGSTAIMAEQAEQNGIALPELDLETQRALHEVVPAYLAVSNPVDNGLQTFQAQSQAGRLRALELMQADPAVDVLAIAFHAPVGWLNESFVDDIVLFAATAQKPIVTIWPSFKDDVPEFRRLVDSGLPIFRSYRGCFRALRALFDYDARRDRPLERAASPRADRPTAIRSQHEGPLPAAAARSLLQQFGVPVVEEHLVTSPAAAVGAARAIGLPVVMKIASRDIPHRSEVGLVRLNVSSDEAVRVAYHDLLAGAEFATPGARVEGVLVQPFLPGGVELIVGTTWDPSFGHALLVGTGGIFAELWQDVAVRLLPVDRVDVAEMIRSLRGFPLLEGTRGRAPANLDALEGVLLAVAALAEACGPELAELDLNPVRVMGDGVVALDYLVVARGSVSPA